MTDTDQQFKLLDPDGEVIMSGPMNIILERLPDTHARNAALDEMLQTAVQAVEGEERQERARVTTAKMLSDVATRLTQRMDAYVARREAQRKADEQERFDLWVLGRLFQGENIAAAALEAGVVSRQRHPGQRPGHRVLFDSRSLKGRYR